MAPILGELAFFLGILQPMTIRARSDGDVQLLVISREDSNELFSNYPEQVIAEHPCIQASECYALEQPGDATHRMRCHIPLKYQCIFVYIHTHRLYLIWFLWYSLDSVLLTPFRS